MARYDDIKTAYRESIEIARAGGGWLRPLIFYRTSLSLITISRCVRLVSGSRLSICHFLAQLCKGSKGFSSLTEQGIDPNHNAYEGKKQLGKTKRGDGYISRGRGFIPITGRYNYDKTGEDLYKDLIHHPELLASDILLALESAGLFWTQHGLNRLADKDDIVAMTHRINGGEHELPDRRLF